MDIDSGDRAHLEAHDFVGADMGTIHITGDNVDHTLPLAATTLLGRHQICTWVLDGPQIPTFWIELRWTEAGWAWRELGGDARGPRKIASALGADWWLIDQGQRINGRGLRVVLEEDGPPECFVVERATGRVYDGDDLHELIADEFPDPLPIDWERRTDPCPPLRDGSAFSVGGRVYRYHEEIAPTVTARGALDLRSPSCHLDLTIGSGKPILSISDGSLECRLSTLALWALVPYIEARRADMPKGGWLFLDEAYSRWTELHPNPTSGPKRIEQDRSRVWRAVVASGVVVPKTKDVSGGKPNTLFDGQKDRGRRGRTRLALPAERVHLHWEDDERARQG